MKGKEYSQAATPAAERAEVRSSTWASSSWTTYFEVAVVGGAEAGGEEVAFGHGADAEFVEHVSELFELGVGALV